MPAPRSPKSSSLTSGSLSACRVRGKGLPLLLALLLLCLQVQLPFHAVSHLSEAWTTPDVLHAADQGKDSGHLDGRHHCDLCQSAQPAPVPVFALGLIPAGPVIAAAPPPVHHLHLSATAYHSRAPPAA